MTGKEEVHHTGKGGIGDQASIAEKLAKTEAMPLGNLPINGREQ